MKRAHETRVSIPVQRNLVERILRFPAVVVIGSLHFVARMFRKAIILREDGSIDEIRYR